MKVYGNLTNRILEVATKGQPEPHPGMAATVTMYSDRHAATVMDAWVHGKALLVTVAEDTVVGDKSQPGGMGHQNWIMTPNSMGHRTTFRWNDTTGRWDCVAWNGKRWVLCRGLGLVLGKRDHYHDWSF